MLDRLVGTRLKQWRKTKGYKLDYLSQVIKVSQGSLSDIENNKNYPSANTITQLYLKTNINVAWMLTGKKGNIDK